MSHVFRKAGLLLVGGVMLAHPALGLAGGPAAEGASGPTVPTTLAAGTPVDTPSASASARTAAGSAEAPVASVPSTQVVTGPAVPTRYGPFQVRVTVEDGTLVGVETLQQPGDGHSRRINQQALPMYEQEALARQSADIQQISGATYTWMGYRTSLQAALDEVVA